jgi:hypothetical protein
MLRKEFENDWDNVNPNQLFVFNLDANGEADYYNLVEFIDYNPVVFYSVSGKPIQQITFWDKTDPEDRYQFSSRYNGDLGQAIERYLDNYEEYKREK